MCYSDSRLTVSKKLLMKNFAASLMKICLLELPLPSSSQRALQLQRLEQRLLSSWKRNFAEVEDNEVEHLRRETCKNLPFGAGHWQHDITIIQDDPAADQTCHRSKAFPSSTKKTTSLSLDVNTPDYLSRHERLL